jgi:ferredoxin
MKVTVDESLCSGCSVCEETCPEVFEIGDDGIATVLVEMVPSDVEDACRQAADECPCEAIMITETEQGEAPQTSSKTEDVSADRAV